MHKHNVHNYTIITYDSFHFDEIYLGMQFCQPCNRVYSKIIWKLKQESQSYSIYFCIQSEVTADMQPAKNKKQVKESVID